MNNVTISNSLFQKPIAIALAVLLSVPLCHAQQQTQQTQPANAPNTETQMQNSNPPPPKPSANTTEPGSPDIQAPAPSSQTTTTTTPQEQQPVGTAAAPYEKPIGSAVSRPAGAAIAPGKQRRRRTFLIKVGLVVGAAVAIGTVVALSKGSPARPNQ